MNKSQPIEPIATTANNALLLEKGRTKRLNPNIVWLALSGAVMWLFLSLPLLALLIRSVIGGTLGEYFSKPSVINALQLSLLTTMLTLFLSVIFGTPLAYLMARYRFPGYRWLDTLLELPMVLPPAVAGVALLITLGRRGWIGQWLDQQFNLTIGFTTTAVVLAQTFVAAPFYIKAAKAGFESVDRNLETVAACLGTSWFQIFLRVTVPLALPSLLGGMVMTWARALGEFGATIMFAGNFSGRTQTMPLAIYAAFDGSGGLDEAVTLSVILVVVSFAVLLTFKWLSRSGARAWSDESHPVEEHGLEVLP
ncbi:MAG: molybdate ABC transporter permease subunit [Chloroflexi bacterium]|uniref:ABC transporter permease n=1 Tax=Candidatus Chlorohelix allophototropha TaxID=3003348 RepID=A0A8T7M791_9CHLR|nr:molybdate ABC transporter permease subunit [Chloroflexota bacterium]WJW69859.1 ABC transporter permease [Chloroflexota bacterium L227-S17]